MSQSPSRTRDRFLLIALLVALACMASCSRPAQPSTDAVVAIQALLPGDYLGEGSRGTVYHRIVPLQVPAFGGQIYYHHISMESFGGPAAQRKFYAFDRADQTMRSTVVLKSGVTLDSNWDMALKLTQLTEEDLLKFPDSCRFEWTAADGAYVGRVERQRCSYSSPAFGGKVSPAMTYRLTPCGLAIQEAIYREDGSPVFPPADVENRRIQEVGKEAAGCEAPP
ncbi:MAG: hypothetical protein AAGA23_04395 [Pseudomonadota bacterium]